MGHKVLIVDDDNFIGEALKILLLTNGIHAEYAENMEETFISLNREKFDVALVDLNMPDANGIDLAMLIMQKQPLISTVLMTGKGTVEDYLCAKSKGISDFLHKPFETALLVRMIREISGKVSVSGMNA